MPVPVGLILGIAAMIGWGIADFLIANAVKKTDIRRLLLWDYIIQTVLLLLVFGFFFPPSSISFTAIIIVIIISIIGLASAFTFYKGLRIGQLSVVAPIANSWPALTVVLSLLFLNESII